MLFFYIEDRLHGELQNVFCVITHKLCYYYTENVLPLCNKPVFYVKENLYLPQCTYYIEQTLQPGNRFRNRADADDYLHLIIKKMR